ncbi:hypothetical protein [Pedobacter sp. NJ-S-72]
MMNPKFRIKKLLVIFALFYAHHTNAQQSKQEKFKHDLVSIQRYKEVYKPTQETAKHAMYLAFDMLLENVSDRTLASSNFHLNPTRERYFPLMAFNLKGVKSIKTVEPNGLFSSLNLEFDKEGHLIKFITKAFKQALSDRYSYNISYKDNAPFKITSNEKGSSGIEFHYTRDTVIVITNSTLAIHKLYDDFLLNTKTYSLSEGSMESENLVFDNTSLVKQNNGGIQLFANMEGEPYYTASSTKWHLPFTRRTYQMKDYSKVFKFKDVYTNDAEGNLVLENIRNIYDKETKADVVYKMKDGRPVSISYVRKFKSSKGYVEATDFGSGSVKVIYEYFD